MNAYYHNKKHGESAGGTSCCAIQSEIHIPEGEMSLVEKQIHVRVSSDHYLKKAVVPVFERAMKSFETIKNKGVS